MRLRGVPRLSADSAKGLQTTPRSHKERDLHCVSRYLEAASEHLLPKSLPVSGVRDQEDNKDMMGHTRAGWGFQLQRPFG